MDMDGSIYRARASLSSVKNKDMDRVGVQGLTSDKKIRKYKSPYSYSLLILTFKTTLKVDLIRLQLLQKKSYFVLNNISKSLISFQELVIIFQLNLLISSRPLTHKVTEN